MKKQITVLTLGAMLFALSFPVEAQQPKIRRIGYLSAGSFASVAPRTEAFRQGLRDLGYVEGKNIVIEYRYAEGRRDRLPELVSELLRLKVDIILVIGTRAVEAAKNATQTMPIVITSGDPVESGFITSLARPGGNITGLSNLTPELVGKQLELLKEVVPKVSRVGVLWTPDIPGASAPRLREAEIAARSLGMQLQVAEVRGPSDLEPAFSSMKRERAGGLVALRSFVIVSLRKRIVDLAAKSRLPAVYDEDQYVEDGGLMSYGADLVDLTRRAATYVDKILKGAKPAELPVEQPMKFELVINLKTAKQIGLTIPESVLFRADRVIK